MNNSKLPTPEMRALEISCYVAGAGAFGVFLRWLQVQLAFNEIGLADKSLFHIVLILYLAVAAFLFLRFIDSQGRHRLFLPEDYPSAFSNAGRLYTVVRFAIAALMALGSLVLFMQAETDKNDVALRIVALPGVISAVCFLLFIRSADTEKEPNSRLLCWASFFMVAFYAVWLVVSYKINNINSVIWSYIIEIIALMMTAVAWFRLAGYPFGRPRGQNCMFTAMAGAMLDVMALADDRHMGMQIMFFCSALMLLYLNWVMVKNLQPGKAPQRRKKEDVPGGFEDLYTEVPTRETYTPKH
ncbi:MAG: hypothetical protein IKT07_10715 [Oscillospiraceae bacterium]|nr:hypothetical protein [Oscillospiraceae bacterium]